MWTRTLNKKSGLLPSSLTLDGLSANDDDEDPAAPAANSTNAKWADGWRAECSMTSVRFDSISNLARALMCCKTMIIPRMINLIERVLSNNGYGCWQTNPLRGRIANLRGQPLLVSYRYPIMRQTTKQTRTYTASKLKLLMKFEINYYSEMLLVDSPCQQNHVKERKLVIFFLKWHEKCFSVSISRKCQKNLETGELDTHFLMGEKNNRQCNR